MSANKLGAIENQIELAPAQNALASSNRLLSYTRSTLELFQKPGEPLRLQKLLSIPIDVLQKFALKQLIWNGCGLKQI
jgi:hypothetical protein